MRHVGEFEDQKIILIGYNAREEKVLFIKPDAFNGADQDWLSKIIESGYAQQQKFLVRALQRETHPGGEDAFVYVMKHGKPLRIPPQDLKMYDKTQSIEWFGEPSNFVLEHERRAGKVGVNRTTTAAEPLFPQPTMKQPPVPQQLISENIEPAMPIPDPYSPIEIPMRAVAPTQKPLDLDPAWAIPPKVAEALKSTSEKLEKLTALEARIRNLEKSARETSKDKKKPAEPAA